MRLRMAVAVGGGEIKRNGRGVEMEEGEWEVR